MRLLGTFGVVLVLLLPAPAQAQSTKVTMADLTGTWVKTSQWVITKKGDSLSAVKKGDSLYTVGPDSLINQGRWFYPFFHGGDTLVIRPDSTFRWANDKFLPFYRFTGDSLYFTKGDNGNKITLKDQQLTITNADTFASQLGREFGTVRKRVGP